MPQPLTDAINALTTYANTVTGASDTTLSDAVATLASGYGGGGGFSADDIASRNISGAITLSLSGNQYIGSWAFANTQITSVNAPNVVHCGNSCFQNCSNLVTANLPMLHETSTINGSAVFRYCSALETVNAPLMRQDVIFDGCSSLISYTNKRPATETSNAGFNSYQFRNCSSLETIDYTYLSQFAAGYAWDGTTALKTIILRRSDAIVPMSNVNSGPVNIRADGIGGVTIYVPNALVSAYETGTQWSTAFNNGKCVFVAIEGSYYETHYADGTPIE